MAMKTANLYARIEPDVKEQAEHILAALGVSTSNAINMFYKQIILQRGLPFEVRIPNESLVDISTLSQSELSAEIQAGYDDYLNNRVSSANAVFERFEEKFK